MSREIDIDSLSFNLLPEDVRIEAMKPHLMNPFEIPEGTALMNPFTFETVNGIMEDGEHYVKNPFKAYEITRKVLFEGGKAVRAWEVNDKNELEEIFKPDDDSGHWGTNKTTTT